MSNVKFTLILVNKEGFLDCFFVIKMENYRFPCLDYLILICVLSNDFLNESGEFCYQERTSLIIQFSLILGIRILCLVVAL